MLKKQKEAKSIPQIWEVILDWHQLNPVGTFMGDQNMCVWCDCLWKKERKDLKPSGATS